MLFEQLLQQAHTNNKFSINSSWGRGRTLFGGLTAALVYERIKQSISLDRPLRSISINFYRCLAADSLSEIKKACTLCNNQLESRDCTTVITAKTVSKR